MKIGIITIIVVVAVSVGIVIGIGILAIRTFKKINKTFNS